MNRMRTSKGSAILEDCWYVLIVALVRDWEVQTWGKKSVGAGYINSV